MRNKVLALILALVMMVSVTVMAPVASFAADGVEALGPDTTTEASALLMALNVLQGYEDGSLQLENNITRAEFAAMLARMLRGTDELNLNAGAIVHDKKSETPENIAAVKAAEEKKAAGITETVTPGESVTETGARGTYYSDIDATQIAEPFSDVTSDHWCYDEVEYLRSLGIVSGNTDGTFRPDENVTYEQVIKFAVAALGYDFMANAYGGYPDGYIRTANQLKILKNVGGTVGSAATRGQVVVLLFNSMTARYLVVDGIVDGNNVYETGKSILKYIYDIDTVTNYNVTATDKSGSILPSGACEEGRVILSGKNTDGDMVDLELNCYDDAVKAYLGYNVKAYIKFEEGSSTVGDLVLMFPSASSKKVTINAEDIKEVDVDDNKITYYEADGDDYDEEVLSWADHPTVIYNGLAMADNNLTEDIFDISNGTVEFVSLKGNKTYDLIAIEDYLPMYVETVKSSTQTLKGVAYKKGMVNEEYEICLDDTLTSKEIKEKQLKDPSFKEVVLEVVNADGSIGDFSSISEESVIEIRGYKSANKRYYTVYLGGNVETGSITKKGSDYIYIGENKYEAIKGSDILSSFKNGNSVKICTTKDGYVFYAKSVSSVSDSLKYGLLMRFSKDDEKFGEESLRVKIMGTDGKIGIYEFAENMKFIDNDGREYKYNSDKAGVLDSDGLMAKLKNTAKYAGLVASSNSLAACAAIRPYEQVIKFSVDSEGKVKEILTARPASTIPDNEDKSNYFTVEDNDVSGNAHHINKGVIYGTPYVVSDATTFFVSKATNSSSYKESEFKVSKIGTGARGGWHGIILYDVDENGKAAIAVTGNDWTSTGKSEDFNRTVAVIEYMQDAAVKKDDEYVDVYEIGIIDGSSYATKYALINQDGKDCDYFGGNDAKGTLEIDGEEKSVYKIGDILSTSLWASGYLYGHYGGGGYTDKAGSTYTYKGFWSIDDLVSRIIADTPDQYFHYAFGTETWLSYEEEFTFGRVQSVGSSRMAVSYGANASEAVSVEIAGKRVIKYDCATGYVSVVSASEITDEDWAFVQQNNKATKMIMFFTNVEEASLDNVKVGLNERD